MKNTSSIVLSFLAIAVAGCVHNPEIEDPIALPSFGGHSVARQDGGLLNPGGQVSWMPTGDMEKSKWEGYQAELQPNATYECVVRSYRSVNLDSSLAAYRRFAPALTTGAVPVRVVFVSIRSAHGAGDGTEIPVLVPIGQYVEVGQRAQVRTVGERETGFLWLLDYAPTRYTEGFPLCFVSNRIYPAQVVGVYRRTINRSDVQFARVAEVGLKFSDSAEVQVLNLAVMGDEGRECVTVMEPLVTIYRAGDLVDYRTYGNPATGFASVKMRQAAGTGDISRRLDPDRNYMNFNR